MVNFEYSPSSTQIFQQLLKSNQTHLKDNKISWEIPFKWKITLKEVDNQITCKVISVLSGISNKSILKLSTQCFNTLKTHSNTYLSKLFQVNHKNLTLIINNGLRGGGGGCCSNRQNATIQKIYSDIYNQNFLNMSTIKEETEKAFILANRIRDSMKSQCIDRESLAELYKVRTQYILDHFKLFNILLENAADKTLWKLFIYYDERKELSYLLRVYFSLGLLNDFRRLTELKSELPQIILTKLEKIKEYLQTEDYEVPESSNFLNITLILEMIKDSEKLAKLWIKKLALYTQVPFLLFCSYETAPSNYFTLFLENYDPINNWIGSKVYGFCLLLNLIENKIRKTSNLTNEIRDLIRLKVIQNLDINKKLCFLEFIERCILFNPTNDSICNFFIEELKATLEIEKNNETNESWKIRERAILVIRTVINLVNLPISETLEHIKNSIQENEVNERVKRMFLLPEINNSKNKNFLYGLEDDIRGIFVREDYIQEIKASLFKNTNIVVVTGLTGMGKKTLCVRFAIQHKNSFDYILKFNCESADSFKNSLNRYASKLSLNNKNDKVVFESLKTLILKNPERSLLIFDKYKYHQTLRKFLSLGVKILIVSSKRFEKSIIPYKSTQKVVLHKLSDQKSIELLNSLSICEIKDKVLEKIVKICAGWPIAIQIVSAEISIHQHNYIEFIDMLDDTLITEDTIKHRIEYLFNELKEEAKIILGIARFCDNYPIPIELVKNTLDIFSSKLDSPLFSEKYAWWNGISNLKNYYIATIDDSYLRIQEHINKSLLKSPVINELNLIDKIPEILFQCLNKYSLDNLVKDDFNKILIFHAESIMNNSKFISLDRFEVAFKLCILYKNKEEISKLEGLFNEIENIESQAFELNDFKRCEYLIDVALFHCESKKIVIKNKLEWLVKPHKYDVYELIGSEYKLKHNEKLAFYLAENHMDKEALHYYSQVLNLQKKIYGEDSPNLVITYKKMAELCEKNEQISKSKDYYLCVHDNIELNTNIYNINLSLLYLSIANAAFRLKEYSDAKKFYLKFLESSPDPCLNNFRASYNLGEIYFQEKEFDSSFRFLDQARVFRESDPSLYELDEQKLYLELGECCQFLNEAEKAENFYKKLITPELNPDKYREIVEKILGMYEYQSQVSNINSVSNMKEKTVEYYTLLINLIETSSNPNKNELISYIEKTIQISSNLQDFESVKNLKIKLLNINRTLQTNKEFIEKLKETGKFFLDIKDYENAYQFYNEALILQKKLNGINSKDNLKILKKLADICVNREQSINNIEELINYLKIYEANLLKYTPEIAKFTGCLAERLAIDNKKKDAKEIYKKAIAIFRRIGLGGEKLCKDYFNKLNELS